LAKKILLTLAKFAASGALIWWLIDKAMADAASKGLDWNHGPRHWDWLAAGWIATFCCLVITIVRWYYLVRALDIPFRLRDAFRLGFLGYLLNFVSLGSVGGDFFRAVFIAREAKHHRAEAVATVFIDRVIGLYILFVMSAIAIWANGLMDSQVPEVQAISWLSWLSSIIGGVGIIMLLVPGFTDGKLSKLLAGLPRIGPIMGKLIQAVRIYRTRLGVLTWVSVLTVLVHSLATIGIYCIAKGLCDSVPTLAEQFVVVPLAMVASAAPLPMMGLGAFETALDVLYKHVPAVVHPTTTEVLKIAVAYRLIQLFNALIGFIVYLFSRREVADIISHADLGAGPIENAEEAAAEVDATAARASA
jgi:uncharacterized membrane protein YbhN (UPF0104 family)